MLVISPASSYQKVALSIQLLFKENLFYISSFTYQEFFHGPSFYMADNFFINSSTNRQKRQSLIQLLFKQRSFYQFSFYLAMLFSFTQLLLRQRFCYRLTLSRILFPPRYGTSTMLHCPKTQEPTTSVRLGITDFRNWSAMRILHCTSWSLRYRRMRVWPARPYSRRLADNHPRNGLDEQLFNYSRVS